MSQRLYIGETKEAFYDCVLTGTDGAKEKLEQQWARPPWKVRIGNVPLFLELESVIADVVNGMGCEYPNGIWAFYHGDQAIQHPNRAELDAWLGGLIR